MTLTSTLLGPAAPFAAAAAMTALAAAYVAAPPRNCDPQKLLLGPQKYPLRRFPIENYL
jgi:hypothetical protein